LNINFDTLRIGKEYDRPFLASLWGYKSFHPLSRGVVTPSNKKFIILFVTKEKQEALQQYYDYIDENLLFWEGENKHGSDNRIIKSEDHGDEIHLFYRDTHHKSFIYYGKISLIEYQENINKPSEFIFLIETLPITQTIFDDLNSHFDEYRYLPETEQQTLVNSRIGQGKFRENLIKLWGSCSLTGISNLSLIKASHIKPWRNSTNSERLNPYNGLLLTPNYDLLFDRGFISFRENGSIIISTELSNRDVEIFHIADYQKLRMVFPENKLFLEYHREKILKN